MFFAVIVFFVALLGVGGLFFIKYRETERGFMFAPEWRVRADEKALRLKSVFFMLLSEAEHVPPKFVVLSRVVVHELALAAAAVARGFERQAHRLADIVSHKHRFERRETNSEFLRQVSEVSMNGMSKMPAPTVEVAPTAEASVPKRRRKNDTVKELDIVK